jgi:hypothetical protein
MLHAHAFWLIVKQFADSIIFIMENPLQFESVWDTFLYMMCYFSFVIGITIVGYYTLYLFFMLCGQDE